MWMSKGGTQFPFQKDHICTSPLNLKISDCHNWPLWSLPAKPHSCCRHCDFHIPKTCCDLHNPEVTRGMFNTELGMNPTKWIPQHAKSNYEKDSKKSKRLNNALYCWRKKEFAQQFPDRVNSMWIGDWIVLGDNIIDDIIYLAHTNKLSDPAKFIQPVDWED